MNNAGYDGEIERPEMSSIWRYYNDIHFARGNYSTVVMSLDSLVDSHPVESEITARALLSSKHMPPEFLFESDYHIANEQLSLLPLMYMGPSIEESSMQVSDIQKWYMDATRGVKLLSAENHNVTCFETPSVEHLMCDNAIICPYRFLERYLTQEVLFPDFSSDKYLLDPKRTADIAIAKMQASMEYEIMLPTFGQLKLRQYAAQFQEYFEIADDYDGNNPIGEMN